MMCPATGIELDPEQIADNVLRCRACGEFVAEDTGVPLDPQPRVLYDFTGPDRPDPGWTHVVVESTVRCRTFADPAAVAAAIEAYHEHGTYRDGLAETIDGAGITDEVETWGTRVIGIERAPVPQHDLLLDHYVDVHMTTHPDDDRSVQRMMMDVSPQMQGILGRDGNYEAACKLAGIDPYPDHLGVVPIDA